VSTGTLKFNVSSASNVGAAAVATIASGATLELAGPVSALGAAGGNRTHVVNNSSSPGLLVSGSHQVVGAIDGTGTTQINAGSDLTADHIIQSALIIGGTSTSHGVFTIAASSSTGSPLAGEPPAFLGAEEPIVALGAEPTAFDSSPALGQAVTGANTPSNSQALSTASVPEPSTIFLASLALIASFSLLRRS
jgi:hypothetical protein